MAKGPPTIEQTVNALLVLEREAKEKPGLSDKQRADALNALAEVAEYLKTISPAMHIAIEDSHG